MLRIKELRIERGLSQRALAAKIKSSQKAIALWEIGKAEPTAHFIVALADCFGCTTDYLLGREDEFGIVNVESDLSDTEHALLAVFRRLDYAKETQLLNFAHFLFDK